LYGRQPPGEDGIGWRLGNKDAKEEQHGLGLGVIHLATIEGAVRTATSPPTRAERCDHPGRWSAWLLIMFKTDHKRWRRSGGERGPSVTNPVATSGPIRRGHPMGFALRLRRQGAEVDKRQNNPRQWRYLYRLKSRSFRPISCDLLYSVDGGTSRPPRIHLRPDEIDEDSDDGSDSQPAILGFRVGDR